ncbi:uncharacterized protein LOC134252684 [Saccostrea cucullata]|uniref:uncharacterized protein LOC134252684 n=1 Tax=Saccostrea cuccullata TaxID=36930 RepID=UPI002ED42DBA
METAQIIIIVLIISGIVCISVSLGTGIMSLLEDYWIDYAYSTTVSTTVSGLPATVVAVAKANIGLFTTCYNIDTTTTVSTGFSTITTNQNSNACVGSETTGYISKDTVTLIQEVGKAAAALIGLALLSGIVILVLFFINKLAKPVCFVSLTPAVFALVSTVMILAAILILNDSLVSGMSLGATATFGYVATVFAFVSTVTYSIAAALIIKMAIDASKTKVTQVTPQDDEKKSQSDLK